MMKSLINRFKKTLPFKDFYLDWITTLKSTILPHLTRTLTSPSPDPLLLRTHVDLLHAHFQTYFSALDLASNSDVTQLLYPAWRNAVEKPFLWLGDFHPYMFTNLLRSFLECGDESDGESENVLVRLGFVRKGCHAWENVDGALGRKVEQIECGLRLMVPAIAARAREAQGGLVDKLAVGWMREGGGLEVGEVVGGVVEEMTCVFLDANRLRRSVLSDVLGVLNVYQRAFFLERLAQFYVGFWDPKLLAQFKKSNLTLD